MNKLLTASVLLFILAALQTKAFAQDLECKFKNGGVDGVDKIELSDESLIINSNVAIPLEKTRVRCGNFGKQVRFDGDAAGYQVILKSCTTEAKLEGELVDNQKRLSADVLCNPKQ